MLTKNAIKQQKTLVRTFAEESNANGERRAANGANFSLALCAKLKFEHAEAENRLGALVDKDSAGVAYHPISGFDRPMACRRI